MTLGKMREHAVSELVIYTYGFHRQLAADEYSDGFHRQLAADDYSVIIQAELM